MPYDYSTLDLERLQELPRYQVPRGFSLQGEPGNDDFLDPPGYPSYFTRAVYTSRGDSPRHGPQLVIEDPDDPEWTYVVDNVTLSSLWIPLPLGHIRVAAWERECYRQWRDCYYDPYPDRKGSHLFIARFAPYYKVPEIRLRTNDKFHILNTANRPEVVSPADHYVVRYISQFYQGYSYNQELIEHPPTTTVGAWWERYAHPEDEDEEIREEDNS